MTDTADAREQAEAWLRRLALHVTLEQERREHVAQAEQIAALLGCPDLDALRAPCRRELALETLRDIRASVLKSIERTRRDHARLLDMARTSPAVQVCVLHRMDRLTWPQVAAKMCYSESTVRRLEGKGPEIVSQQFVPQGATTPESLI